VNAFLDYTIVEVLTQKRKKCKETEESDTSCTDINHTTATIFGVFAIS